MFSFCIPKIETHLTKEYIRRAISFHNIGEIFQIDLVRNKQSDSNKAFVHFEKLYNTNKSRQVLFLLKDKGEDIKLFHNFPDYWVCKFNKSKHKMRKKYHYKPKNNTNVNHRGNVRSYGNNKKYSRVRNNERSYVNHNRRRYNSYRNNYERRDYYVN